MLNLDPRSRISTQGILRHPWITNLDKLPDFKLTLNDSDSVKVRLLKILFRIL